MQMQHSKPGVFSLDSDIGHCLLLIESKFSISMLVNPALAGCLFNC